MSLKLAPYKCSCRAVFYQKETFRLHLEECPEAQEFLKTTRKIFKEYQKLESLAVKVN